MVLHGLNGVRDEIEAPRLVGLGFLLLPANDAFVGHEEKIPERVQGFAFVELGIDPPAVVFILQVAQDKERRVIGAFGEYGMGVWSAPVRPSSHGYADACLIFCCTYQDM